MALLKSSDEYFEMIDQLGVMKSADEGSAFLRRVADIYGFRDMVYLSTDMPRGNDRRHFFLGTYNMDWQQHYVDQTFMSIDPVITQGLRSILPYHWNAEGITDVVTSNFFERARDFGISQHGITFPIRGRMGEHGFVTICADEKSDEWKKRVRYFMRDFQLLSYHIHQMVIRCENIHLKEINLTPREKECLKWASKGKSAFDIGTILSISERTVRFHLELARHKLDAMNITQAVANALSLHLL